MRHDYVANIFLHIFNWGIHFVSRPYFFSCCRGWMWAHGDVSRQRNPGIQELSWDVPKLHFMRKENPSASRKTPDLKNWRPGYRITEMRIQLPYHPELFNIAWYVKHKAAIDAWIGKSVSKTQVGKMQEMSALVLSSSSSNPNVSLLAWEAVAPHTVCCAARTGGAAVLQRGHRSFCPALAHPPTSRALPSDLWAVLSQLCYSTCRDLCQPCTLLR